MEYHYSLAKNANSKKDYILHPQIKIWLYMYYNLYNIFSHFLQRKGVVRLHVEAVQVKRQ